MTEPKTALKLRWTPKEVAMLVEVWEDICIAPGAGRLKGEQLHKIIFDRYNARCARTRQLRRSPPAVHTQRVRMTSFARFVRDFDRRATAQRRRSWFQLSTEEQLEMDIPNEWRRQITTFSKELYKTFSRCILPLEDAHVGAIKRDKKSKKSCREVGSTIEHQPCWTVQDKVTLAGRWGDFMRIKGLKVKEFEQVRYGSSCECLALPGRSAFSTWRKLCSLVSSWHFICAFNTQHQPGWFELTETERDELIMWGELPNNFEDIEQQVFAAMEEAAPVNIVPVKEEVQTKLMIDSAPPSPKSLSPLLPASFEPAPLLPQVGMKVSRSDSTETNATLDSLLLEDDGAEDANAVSVGALESSNSFVSNVRAADARPQTTAAVMTTTRQEIKAIDPKPILNTETRGDQALNETLHNLKREVETSFRRLEQGLEGETQRFQDYIRTTDPKNRSIGFAQLAKHMKLALTQQYRRVISVLQFEKENCVRNGGEMQSLVQEFLRNDDDLVPNGSAGIEEVKQASTSDRLAQF